MRHHFIHVSKTGGTAIMAALRPLAQERNIVLHPHTTRLKDIPPGEKVFFALREPVSRFVSGFHSRLRMEQPGHHVPWTEAEKVAFREFSTPNELAEALSSPGDRVRARYAMQNIGHVKTRLIDWFDDARAVHARRHDILLIAFQETLDADFAKLVSLLGLPGVALPKNDVAAHRSPQDLNHALSDKGRENIAAWYEADIRLYDRLREVWSQSR